MPPVLQCDTRDEEARLASLKVGQLKGSSMESRVGRYVTERVRALTRGGGFVSASFPLRASQSETASKL